MTDANPRKKKKKAPFLKRMANRGREAKALGQVLANEPRSFPSELLKLIKRSLRTVWDARGGGLYACGFLITFVFLEFRMFFVDIYEAKSASEYFSSQVSELLFKYIGESFQNTISAFMWPVYIIEIHPAWGAGILAAMFVLFPKFLKEPLERWLFVEDRKTGPDDSC
ncbi:MAG: hypothetical protein O3A13_11660 [Proteobacteria bacterium]|nr:hypothetical protein [Pseudomonadota bacterium]MDA0994268.1 hypothetical protein [Pseudomonadota bacterium]